MTGGLSATLYSVTRRFDAMFDAMNRGVGSAFERNVSFVDHAFSRLRQSNQTNAADQDRN